VIIVAIWQKKPCPYSWLCESIRRPGEKETRRKREISQNAERVTKRR